MAECGIISRASPFVRRNSRRRHVLVVPRFQRLERRVGQGAAQIPPYSRMMTKILRLAIAAGETGEDAEHLGGALRAEGGVMLEECVEVEGAVARAPRLDVAADEGDLDRFRHVNARILQQ